MAEGFQWNACYQSFRYSHETIANGWQKLQIRCPDHKAQSANSEEEPKIEESPGKDIPLNECRDESRSRNFESSQNDEEDDLLPPPLLEPGTYIGRCTDWRLRPFRMNEDKLYFTINVEIESGETVALERWYNVIKLKNCEQGAGFRTKLRSDYRREYIALFPEAAKERLDRLYPFRLVGLELNVAVRNPVHDTKHELIPEGARYSVIGKILSRVDKE